MTVRVLFMGRLKETAGAPERVLPLPTFPLSVSTLIDTIAGADDMLAEALRAPQVRIIVDHVVIRNGDEIKAAKEIAFLPPVSGG